MTARGTRTVPVNGDLVRQRMFELALSERELGRRIGSTSSALRSIISRNEMTTSFALADVRRLVEALGVTWGDLLDVAAPEPAPPTDDANELIALLTGQKRAHSAVRLARALGWTLDRLTDAERTADAHLSALGLAVHRASNGLVLRARKNTAHRPREVLHLLRDDEEGLKQGAARVLFAAMQGTLSPQENRNDHNVQLAWLFNVGALMDRRAKGGSRNSLSDDTAYCLDF